MPTVPTDLTPEALRRDNKCPHDEDDEIREVPDEDRPAEPPKKKKKKKNKKNSKEAVPSRKDEDEGTRPSTSTVEPKDVANEATPAPVPTKVLAEETTVPKKKKKPKKGCRTREVSVRALRSQGQRNVQDQTPETPV